MAKVLTVPDTTPAFSISPTFGTTEVQVTPAVGGGGGGGVESVTSPAESGIIVDNTDPANPVLFNDGVIDIGASGGVALSVDGSSQHPILITDPRGALKFIQRFDDFDDSGSPTTGAAAIVNGAVFGRLGWRAGFSGTGGAAVTYVTTNQDVNHQGVVRLSRGTTAANVSTMGRGTATALGRTTLGPGIKYKQGWLVWIETLADATNDYIIRFGNINDTTVTTPTNGVYFEYVRTASVNWRGCSTSASVVTVASGGTPVAVAAGTWIYCEWEFDGTTYTFRVSGVVIGTTAAPQTTPQPEQCGIAGIAGALDRGVQVDLFVDQKDWSVSRAA